MKTIILALSLIFFPYPANSVTLLEYEIIGDATEVYLKHLDKINQMIKKEIEQ